MFIRSNLFYSIFGVTIKNGGSFIERITCDICQGIKKNLGYLKYSQSLCRFFGYQKILRSTVEIDPTQSTDGIVENIPFKLYLVNGNIANANLL